MKLALGRLGSAGTRTLIQRAIASLRARGADAHLWLPGVGTLNGLTTGNYLESTGNSVATVDNPTGLVLDALGSVGAELVTNGGFDSDTGWTKGDGWTISGGVASHAVSATGASQLLQENADMRVSAGKTYQFIFSVTATVGNVSVYIGGTWIGDYTSGSYSRIVLCSSANTGTAYSFAVAQTSVCSIDNISVREVSGIHLTQGTTANKGLLKQDAGSRYYWLFDATDLLTGTFPAGYESVTVIDAKSTGQVTTSAANVVGSYSIGPSYSSYGRIIIKGSITASELALYQGFANRLAGL